jgi:hypothetical protein
MLDQILEQSELASCEVITFQVMAVAGVSPGDPNAVGAVPEGGKEKLGAHPRGARNPDDPDIGGVLKATDPCQVCRAVAAPVAQECGYFRLPVVHGSLQGIRIMTTRPFSTWAFRNPFSVARCLLQVAGRKTKGREKRL